MADDEVEALVRAHEAQLLRLAFLLCHDSARAEDLVQDTLIRVLRRWRAAGVVTRPLAYARKVLVNEFLAWRRLRASSEHVGMVDDVAVGDHADGVAERDVMWRLLGGLPVRARTVLALRYYEQLPDADIAAILGCRQATVRSIASRALQTLRAHPSMILASEES